MPSVPVLVNPKAIARNTMLCADVDKHLQAIIDTDAVAKEAASAAKNAAHANAADSPAPRKRELGKPPAVKASSAKKAKPST